MADTPRTWSIMQALQARLQQILIANGYRTDAGADVRLEKSQLGTGTRLTVYAGQVTHPDGTLRNEREFALVVEGTVPVELEDAQQQIIALAEDVEEAFDTFVPMPGALPLTFHESLFLDCPEGMPAMAVQLMFGTRFRR
jgi:hypothetical protein